MNRSMAKGKQGLEMHLEHDVNTCAYFVLLEASKDTLG